MISRISFHELAELELREAAQYYDSEVPGLGSAFLDEIDYSLHQIVRHPNAAPLIHDVVRRKLLRRFPYSLLYSFEGNSLSVLAVASQKRRPFYWKSRRR